MIKVAVVECDFFYRFLLERLFENSDLFNLAGTYASAEEALPNLLKRQPDVAIIDIQLPVMSGISLIQRLRDKMPRTQFMIFSSSQDNSDIFAALKAGASGYILKSATGQEITTAVKDLFMGGAPISPGVARKIISLFQNKRSDLTSFGLSEREQEVLKLMSKGMLYKEMAERLAISSNTIKNHLRNIYKKMNVQNKIEAINKYQSA